MADIEIGYHWKHCNRCSSRSGHTCEYNDEYERECEYYSGQEERCYNAQYEDVYLGKIARKYEVIEQDDWDMPIGFYKRVKIGNTWYDNCFLVKIDGKTIFARNE